MTFKGIFAGRGVSVVLLTALGLLAPGLPGNAAESSWCEAGVEYVEGVGRACELPNGLYQLETPDGPGTFTHGPDLYDPIRAARSADARTEAVSSDPTCVTDPNDYQIIVTYAHPTSNNLYASRVGPIREMVRASNGRLNEESGEFGSTGAYKVRCDTGTTTITVLDQPLSTPATTDFGPVTNALRALGGIYVNQKYKHWIWYEGSGGAGVLGVGNIENDDRLVVDNENNGTSGYSMMALQWGKCCGGSGYFDVTTWMHENGHNLGAVQDSAPKSSLAGHCIDGLDIMCYDDGGPGGTYTETGCTDREHFDCRHDTYFNLAPAAGSYLATKWNLGSCLNRFMAFSICGGGSGPGALAFSMSAQNTSEAAGSLSISVTRTGGTTGAVGASYATTAGTATAGSDFTSTSGTVSFANGVSSATFLVPILNDSEQEPNENFTVTLSAPTGGATLGSTTTQTITIIDDDSTGPVDHQPDLMVSKASAGPFRGDDVFNTNAGGQTIGKNGRRFVEKTFYLLVENAGPLTQPFTIVEGVHSTGLGVSYYFQGSDVTDEVFNGTELTLDAGAAAKLRVVLWFDRTFPSRTKKSVEVAGMWTNPNTGGTLFDVVRFNLLYR